LVSRMTSMNSPLQNKRVFAVVVTYNGEKWIRKCIRSLTESHYPVQIIVIDNGSVDATVDIIKEEFVQVELFDEKQNLGFGKATNKGMSKALSMDANFLFLLNQDAWIEKNTISHLVDAFNMNQGYGIISPLHFAGSGFSLDAGFVNCLSKKYDKKMQAEFLGIPDDPMANELSFINAAAWLVSRECLEKVGGFNPLFYHYGEDADFVNRLKFNHLKIGFVTNCRIFHDRELRDFSASFGTFKKLSWYYNVGLLVRLVDVNRFFVIAFTASFFWSTKEIASHFFKGRWHSPIGWLNIWSGTIVKLPLIFRNRKTIKSKRKFLFLN